ncbi:protein of unknown function [Rhodovastum atsumiense]|nr:protein of unknown function [Rhodovastum atsumiense]
MAICAPAQEPARSRWHVRRLTGNGDEVMLLFSSRRGDWEALGDFGSSAMPLDEALQRLTANPCFREPRRTCG